MAKKWTIKEDLIVCNFCYDHDLIYYSPDLVDELVSILNQEGFVSRSWTAVQKRARTYVLWQYQSESTCAPKQVKSVYKFVHNKNNAAESYQAMQSFISKVTGNTNFTFNNYTTQNDVVAYTAPPVFDRDNLGPSFKDLLAKKIKERGLKAGKAAAKCDLQSYIFSDIKHDRIKKLDRVIIMKICLGLHLGYQESVELLQSAGCTFDNSLFDAIIQWYLHQEDYELEEVDIALEANQLNCIFSCE